MRISLSVVGSALFLQAVAHPDLAKIHRSRDANAKQALEWEADKSGQLRKRVLFDASAQYVSNTGAHAFQAPGSGDTRGPCPGLNTMANHGYISRSGYTNIAEALAGMGQAFGIAPDLGAFLGILAAVQSGDGFTFSIGGPPPPTLLNTLGLIGQPEGLSRSHNRFETDQSISRDDLYQTGNDVTLNLHFFQQLYDSSKGPYTLQDFGQHCVDRFNYAVANDPYFFKGVAAQFIPEATSMIALENFANKSAEHPAGFLSRTNLMSFYSITMGSEGELQYTPGHERIPDNFYKFNPTDEFTIAEALTGVAEIFAMYPGTVQFGGNTGTVNSFTGINLANATGGVFNGETLLQGNNAACYVMQNLAFFQPDLIRNAGILRDVTGAVANITDAIDGTLAALSCPQLAKFDADMYDAYPGWTRTLQNV